MQLIKKTVLLEDLCSLVASVPVKFEACAAKIVGGVRLFRLAGFLKKHFCQFTAPGCQFDNTDIKLGNLQAFEDTILKISPSLLNTVNARAYRAQKFVDFHFLEIFRFH